ncbi:MAG TPA: hypothetical protein VEO01_00725, partial [Pseudonocardiaceae bacterium]|nr:hypothetical protein [Pseudonocardiaceae bacterium]
HHQTSAANPDGGTDRREPPRPQTPVSAQPQRTAFDGQGTMYAPTSLSMENSVYIADACPMHYELSAEDTYLVFGDTNLELSLMVSDRALVEIVRMAIRALDAMVNARGNPVPNVADRNPD